MDHWKIQVFIGCKIIDSFELHLVFSDGPGLIQANNTDSTQVLYGLGLPGNDSQLTHTIGPQGHKGGECDRYFFRNGSHGKGKGK